jgi:uncharacterized protein
MHEMSIQAVGIGNSSEPSVVILSDAAKERALPIWIGPAEATMISRALTHGGQQRPLTHQLTLNIIDQLGYKVDHLEINELSSSTFFGKLCLLGKAGTNEFNARVIDCRPSDGIAIAAVAKAPIMVTPEIFQEATVALQPEVVEEPDDEFKAFIENLKPSDFPNPDEQA